MIHKHHDGMIKTYKKIAVDLTQNPNNVALGSVNSIATHCSIHASSFVRFAQSLGFKGFRELQAIFRQRLTTAAPRFEARIKALENYLDNTGSVGAQGLLRDLVVRDTASLEDLIRNIPAEDLVNAVHLMDEAETIYLLGQLRSAPVIELFRYVLTMLGKKTVLLDPGGGLATHMSRVIGPDDLLIAVSFRFYANEVVNVVGEIAARGVPILAISDSTLSPLAKSANVLFAVPELSGISAYVVRDQRLCVQIVVFDKRVFLAHRNH